MLKYPPTPPAKKPRLSLRRICAYVFGIAFLLGGAIRIATPPSQGHVAKVVGDSPSRVVVGYLKHPDLVMGLGALAKSNSENEFLIITSGGEKITPWNKSARNISSEFFDKGDFCIYLSDRVFQATPWNSGDPNAAPNGVYHLTSFNGIAEPDRDGACPIDPPV